jgi:hypothetical protein
MEHYSISVHGPYAAVAESASDTCHYVRLRSPGESTYNSKVTLYFPTAEEAKRLADAFNGEDMALEIKHLRALVIELEDRLESRRAF